MCLLLGCNIVLTVSPDEDRMPLQCTTPDRVRTAVSDPDPRDAAGRVASRARPRPAQVQRGARRRGRDGRGSRGRPRCRDRPHVALAVPSRGRRPRGCDGAPGPGTTALPAGRRGRSASPTAGSVRAAGRLCALDFASAGPRAGRAGLAPGSATKPYAAR